MNSVSGDQRRRTSVSRRASAFSPRQSALKRNGVAATHWDADGKPSLSVSRGKRAATATKEVDFVSAMARLRETLLGEYLQDSYCEGRRQLSGGAHSEIH